MIIYEVANELGIKVLKLAINPDHLHLVYPTIPPHKIVKRIKSRNSRILRQEFLELLKLPSRPYFVTAIGNVSKETIKFLLRREDNVGYQG